MSQKTAIVRSLREVAPAEWDALLSPHEGPFSRWAYLEAMESTGVVGEGTGWEPHHFVMREAGKLVAAAPAYLKSNASGEFLFDGAWASAAERFGLRYFPKLVLAIPYAAVPGRRVFARSELLERAMIEAVLDTAAAAGESSVHVHFSDPPLIPKLEAQGFARRLSVQYVWENAGYASYDDFLLRFTARRRKQLKREARRVAESGIEIRTVRAKEIDADLAHALHAATVARYARGPKAMPRDFFRRLVTDFPENVEFVEARRSGEVVAGALNFVAGDRMYGRYWGTVKPEPFLHFATCLYHPVADCIARGLLRYHPGAGGEHKLTRGFTPTLAHSAHRLFDERLDVQVRRFLDHERAALEQGLPLWERETGFKASRKAT